MPRDRHRIPLSLSLHSYILRRLYREGPGISFFRDCVNASASQFQCNERLGVFKVGYPDWVITVCPCQRYKTSALPVVASTVRAKIASTVGLRRRRIWMNCRPKQLAGRLDVSNGRSSSLLNVVPKRSPPRTVPFRVIFDADRNNAAVRMDDPIKKGAAPIAPSFRQLIVHISI